MKTLTVDDNQRVCIPDAKPHQVFTYAAASDGTVTLTPIEVNGKESFPPGSLLKYMTSDRDEENESIFSGCVTGPE